MGAKVGTEGAFNEMNLTPLIDVVLVVLIIMMVSIPVKIQKMGVKVPDPTPDNEPPPPPEIPPDQLVVAMYADGRIALNRRVMTAEKMSYELTRRLKPMAKKNVFVDADLSVKYADVIEMVEVAKAAGAAKVGLSKVKEKGPQVPTSVDNGAMPRGIVIGTPVINGMITEKGAYEGFAVRQSALMGCYSQALAGNPSLSGRMMVTLYLNPDGSQFSDEEAGFKSPKVSSNQLDGTYGDLESCMMEALKDVRTKPLQDENRASVTYPILFSPG